MPPDAVEAAPPVALLLPPALVPPELLPPAPPRLLPP